MKQEEKAKRYDELLLKLQKAKVDDNVCDEMYYRVIDDIVPELKESEDERIRKAIHIYFDWLDGRKDYQPKGEYTIRDMIAWLEKQGKQKQDPCEHCADKRLNCHNFPCIKGRAFKQGKSVFDIINEEKVDNANFHLWTIQDAKDGDVLNSPSHHLIWIYKDHEHFYACVNMNYVKDNIFTEGLIVIPEDACPANKLQRDILFSKMKEAGYKWDADKKELKKIEQKSVGWSEEDEAIWAEISDLIREGYKQSDSKFSWDDIRNWVNTKLLKGRVQLQNITVTDEELAQAKKEAYNDALDKIEYHSGEPTFDDGWGAAIWYLKNRNAQPQNTWKPSDEQMKALSLAMCGVGYPLFSLYQDLEKLKG